MSVSHEVLGLGSGIATGVIAGSGGVQLLASMPQDHTMSTFLWAAMEKGGAFAFGVAFIGVPFLLIFLRVIRPDMKEESAKRDARAAVERETAVATAAAASSLKEAADGLKEAANRLAVTQEMANETLEQARDLVRQATGIRTHKEG